MASAITSTSTGDDATLYTALIGESSLEKQLALLMVAVFKREKTYNSANPTANQLSRFAVSTDFRNNTATFSWATNISNDALDSGLVASITSYLP